jgi:hypothetical protein
MSKRRCDIIKNQIEDGEFDHLIFRMNNKKHLNKCVKRITSYDSFSCGLWMRDIQYPWQLKAIKKEARRLPNDCDYDRRKLYVLFEKEYRKRNPDYKKAMEDVDEFNRKTYEEPELISDEMPKEMSRAYKEQVEIFDKEFLDECHFVVDMMGWRGEKKLDLFEFPIKEEPDDEEPDDFNEILEDDMGVFFG